LVAGPHTRIRSTAQKAAKSRDIGRSTRTKRRWIMPGTESNRSGGAAHHAAGAPAKFVFAEDWQQSEALDSLISQGCVVSGSRIRGSILCQRARAQFHDVQRRSCARRPRGAASRIRKVIDRDVHIRAARRWLYEEDQRRRAVSEWRRRGAAGEEPLCRSSDEENWWKGGSRSTRVMPFL
jgi:hypothetical protein